MITISFVAKINGNLVDVDSIEFADQTGSFGVRRVDTGAVIVAEGTALTRASIGTYTYSFAEPEANLQYQYSIKLVYLGVTYYYNRFVTSGSISSLIVIPSTDHYSSQAEVYRLLGKTAADLIVSDHTSEDKAYLWNDLLQDVDETISMYVLHHYDPAQLYTNQWIRRRATLLACNLLSQRRGANELYRARTERIYEELNSIRDNRFIIPGAIPRSWQGPVVRNYIIQNRFLQHPVRVEKTQSTGDSYGNEDIAWEPFIYNGIQT